MSNTYTIDSLYPDRLRCAECGEAVATVPEAGPVELRSLTADQAGKPHGGGGLALKQAKIPAARGVRGSC
jgi:hypothetical protein